MKRLVLAFVFLGGSIGAGMTGAAPAFQDSPVGGKPTRGDFVSEASWILGTWTPEGNPGTAEGMAAAGRAYVESLDANQKAKGVLKPDDPERREWTNLPPQPGAGGIRLGELDRDQVRSACQLLAAVLSNEGYRKMCLIMLGDDQLLDGGKPRPGFGVEQFSLVVFGEPSPSEPWGLQLDGHHIGLNLSIHGSAVGMSPGFVGAQPESFEISGRSYRPFAGEIDGGYALIGSLRDDQRRAAVLSPKRGFIRTGPGADGQVPEPAGVDCGGLDTTQKELLKQLIWQWVGTLPPLQADLRMEQLMSEIGQMRFSWNGSSDPRSDVSWTIQSPTLIIEFSCQGSTSSPLSHVHSMYRNPRAEYSVEGPREPK